MRPDQLGRAHFLFYLFPQRAISVRSAEIAFLLKTNRYGWAWVDMDASYVTFYLLFAVILVSP